MGPPGPVRAVAMFITVDSGVPAGNNAGSRGSCRLQGKVLPLLSVGWHTPPEAAAIGTACGSVTPVLVECRCLNTLMLTPGSKSSIFTICDPGSEPRAVCGLQTTSLTSVYPLAKLLAASMCMLSQVSGLA